MSTAFTPDATWQAVCQLDDLPVLGSRRVARPQGAPVALFRLADDSVHALLDRCPHKGGPLSQGIVMAHGVTCPLHHWVIAFADGQAQAPDTGHTPCFAVQVHQGTVWLRTDELQTLGTDLPLPQAGPCRHPCAA